MAEQLELPFHENIEEPFKEELVKIDLFERIRTLAEERMRLEKDIIAVDARLSELQSLLSDARKMQIGWEKTTNDN